MVVVVVWCGVFEKCILAFYETCEFRLIKELCVHLQTMLSFDNNYFMDEVDGRLQCISMQNVKDLLEANYAYLSGV